MSSVPPPPPAGSLLGPVFDRELRRLGARRTYRMLLCGIPLLASAVLASSWSAVQATAVLGGLLNGQSASAAAVARQLTDHFFHAFTFTQAVLAVALTPPVVAGAIARQRQNRLLELLLLTDLNAPRILLGFVLPRLAMALYLIASALPVLALAGFLGGIGPGHLALSLLVGWALVLSLGGISTLVSMLAGRTSDAVFGSYLAAGVLLLGLPMLADALAPLAPAAGLARADWHWWTTPLTRTPFAALERFRTGAGGSVWDHLRPAVLTHAAIGVVTLTGSLALLRRAATTPPGRSRRRRSLLPRPRLGAQTLRWRDTHARDYGVFDRWYRLLLDAACWLLLAATAWTAAADWWDGATGYRMVADRWLGRVVGFPVWTGTYGGAPAMEWLPWASATLFVAALVGVCVRGALTVVGERERGTFDDLLLSPLETDDLLRQKRRAAVDSFRRPLLLLAATWTVAACAGTLGWFNVVVLVPLVAAAAAVLATAGVYFSCVRRTSAGALAATLGTLTAWCVLPLMCACLFTASPPLVVHWLAGERITFASLAQGGYVLLVLAFYLLPAALPACLLWNAFRRRLFAADDLLGRRLEHHPVPLPQVPDFEEYLAARLQQVTPTLAVRRSELPPRAARRPPHRPPPRGRGGNPFR